MATFTEVGRDKTAIGCRTCGCANCSPDNDWRNRKWETDTNGNPVRCAVCGFPAMQWVATNIDKARSKHPQGWTGFKLLPYGTQDWSGTVHPLSAYHENWKWGSGNAPTRGPVGVKPDPWDESPDTDEYQEGEPVVKPKSIETTVFKLPPDLVRKPELDMVEDALQRRMGETQKQIKNLTDNATRELQQLASDHLTTVERLNAEIKRLEEMTKRTAPVQIVIGTGARAKKKDVGRVHADLVNMAVMIDAIGDSGIVYGVGEAGSGKSTASEKLADMLGLDLYMAVFHAGMSDMDVLGYRDVTGKYIETQFYLAYKNGGLMIMDEFSRTSESAAAMVNGMTANSITAFPCGVVKRNPKTRFVAFGNTYGRDAQGTDSLDYIGTSQLDAATLSRFCYIPFNTDWALLGEAFGVPIDADTPRFPAPGKPRDEADPLVQGWGKRVKEIRDVVQSQRIEAAITSRAFINGYKFLRAGLDVGLVYFSVIWAHMSYDDAETVRANLGIDERGERVIDGGSADEHSPLETEV